MSEQCHVTVVGNTRSALLLKLRQGGKPVDLSGAFSVTTVGEKDDGTEWFAETSTGVTAEPTNAFTADASADKLKHNATPVEDGDEIVVATDTTLPAGLAASTRYFVRDAEPNAFKVSLTPDGDPVDITDAGTGNHTYYIVGSVRKVWQAAEVATAMDRGWLWVYVYSSAGVYDAFPVVSQSQNRGFKVRIVEVG